jgi:hypothetical protein
MITPKIKALFRFIEYLHSNIDNFNRNNELIKELELLNEERQKVSSKRNFTDKLRYNEIQAEIEQKFKVLQDNTATLIKGKAKELNVCNFDNEPNYSFNGIEAEIHQLKESFSRKDLPEIAKRKRQYIEYRQNTHKTFLSLGFFIDELDGITKSLFDYFKDTGQNEYEAFETKTFEAGSIKEAVQIYFNEAHKDQRFWLSSFIEEIEQTKPSYKSFQKDIENNGWVVFKTEMGTVKIYAPELAVIFTSKEFPARNMDTKQETTINGLEYLKTYIEAYKEGEQAFETEYKISPDTLYGAMAEQYVRDIHLNFFHIRHTGANEGWGYVKKQYPFVLSHRAVNEFGYYSGIVNKVEEQIRKYPGQFANFDKCEHGLPPEPVLKQKPEESSRLITFKNIETIEKIHSELKGYFPNKEAELLKALKGEQLSELLLFPHNQNRFVEVFRRLKYNDLLLNTDTETRDWICSTFQYVKKRFEDPQPFNKSSVWDNLNKGKGEPAKKQRICITEWLPYKSHSQLQNERDRENY